VSRACAPWSMTPQQLECHTARCVAEPFHQEVREACNNPPQMPATGDRRCRALQPRHNSDVNTYPEEVSTKLCF
jgi:hypothetical protein